MEKVTREEAPNSVDFRPRLGNVAVDYLDLLEEVESLIAAVEESDLSDDDAYPILEHLNSLVQYEAAEWFRSIVVEGITGIKL